MTRKFKRLPNWKLRAAEWLPVGFYAPFTLLSALAYTNNSPGSITLIPEYLNISGWWIILVGAVLALITVLPFVSLRWKALCMIPAAFYGILAAIGYVRVGANPYTGYVAAFVFAYLSVAAFVVMGAIEAIHEEREERDYLITQIDFYVKLADDHKRILAEHGSKSITE